MSLYIGIDTSNYTTSVAIYNSDLKKVIHKKQLLPVKQGERGIRQSDAVFHHTAQISKLMDDLLLECKREGGIKNFSSLKAIGVSSRPRNVKGSYMPCFTVGMSVAHSLSTALGVPCYEFSHQEGHVVAALYSAGKLDLLNTSFLAFHVSGGTTESLIATPTDSGIPTINL